MAISKRGDKFRVFTYDPRLGRKTYSGQRDTIKEARALHREKTIEFQQPAAPPKGMTYQEYADHWLEHRHGPGTKRPAKTSYTHNEGMLRTFLGEFGGRPVDGGVDRGEALTWAASRPSRARVVAAMLNDAINEGKATANPFANRQLPTGQGRRHIAPLRESEVDRLAEIGLKMWGERTYGIRVRAWILFSAWVGSRPGETANVQWADVDFDRGMVRVQRVKGRKQEEWVVLPAPAANALKTIPGDRVGLIFTTIIGRHMDKGGAGYLWRPIRAAFVSELAEKDPIRLAEFMKVKGSLDLYSLRHYAGSIMVDRGLNEFDVAQQLGNSPEVCRETYVHVHVDRAQDRIRAAMNRPTLVDLDAARERKRGA